MVAVRVFLGRLVQLMLPDTVKLGSAMWGFVGTKEALLLMGSFGLLT